MVVRERSFKMASDQPVQKRLRRAEDDTDEPDFIQEGGMRTDLSSLHLSLPSNVNESDISLNMLNTINTTKDPATSNNALERIQPAEINTEETPPEQERGFTQQNLLFSLYQQNNTRMLQGHYYNANIPQQENTVFGGLETKERRFLEPDLTDDDFDDIQNYLVRQCLCGVSEEALRRPFEAKTVTDASGTRNLTLTEWPTPKILRFLSKLQLLFDVYLKQNNKGYICTRIVDVCSTIIRNEYNLIEQIIALCGIKTQVINFLSAKVIASFLIIAKTNINNEWLETIVNYLTVDSVDYEKMNFALDIIKHVVEWKDIDIHVLEENSTVDGAGTSSQNDIVSGEKYFYLI